MSKQIAALEAGAEIVVATPGRLIDLIDRKVADLSDVGLVVIDEADRMADMGFMPQVEWVLRHIEGGHQTLLFSATLDGGIQGLVDRYQRDPVFHEVGSPTQTVEKMAHRFLLVHEMDKHRVAAAISRSGSRCLVFTNTKRAADRLARQLEDDGVDAKAIHGDLRQEVRERALKRFSEGKLAVLVATDVAARGLDIDELDIVIQADPPPDPKTYLHRAGPHRPGRRRRPGGHAGAVERGARGAAGQAPSRPRRADRRDVLQRRAPGRPRRAGTRPPRAPAVAERLRGRRAGSDPGEREGPQQRRERQAVVDLVRRR